jgi:hypothetical protein
MFPLTSASRLAVEATPPPIQWVPGALSPGVKHGRGLMLTTHPLLVLKLRKSRSYTSCHPKAPLWGVTGPLYLLPFTYPIDEKIFHILHASENNISDACSTHGKTKTGLI